jgi:hypothetical protein
MHIRVLIAVVVLLIAGALVWVIAASSDAPEATKRATSPPERKAVRIDKRLAKDPTDTALLATGMKAWIGAGAERFEHLDLFSKPIQVPDAVVEDYESGLGAWNEYLKQTGGEANAYLSGLAAAAFFQLVEIGSADPAVATANAAGAVRAERILSKRDPNSHTLSELAIYQYFNGESAAGDETARRALKVSEKSVRDAIQESIEGSKERGEKFAARVKRGSETLEETGDEELDEPIKGYGSAAGINGYEPGTGPNEPTSES